jgi:hypothetical protein
MDTTTSLSERPIWPVWRTVLFRFALIYLVLYTAPWSFISTIPGMGFVAEYYGNAWDWIVRLANTWIFQIAKDLVPMAGSGDTSFGWAQMWFTLLVAFVGCVIWTILDRKRTNYEQLDYWLKVTVRYFLAYFCFVYGIIKIYALQMPFPNISQLATPLGDFLPMRLSWMFVGYSAPYQVFSGVMEFTAGLLLLNRRTVTLGLLMATGVFTHVVALNLAYDIPVKLFSLHLLAYCLYLLSYEFKRLLNFFVFNRVAAPDTSFARTFNSGYLIALRTVGKIAFIILAVIVPLYNNYQFFQSQQNVADLKPIKPGMYDVDLFVLNGQDTVPALITDSLRWNDLVFERGGLGSIKTTDAMFRQRYRRGYFSYKPDTVHEVLELRYFPTDSLPLMSMKYKLSDENTIQLWSKYKEDSLYVRLRPSKRHFQLTERQFHWLSEANR